jgi:hypothetical protein
MSSRSNGPRNKQRRRLTVNDRPYTAWIICDRIDEAGNAHIHVTLRAEYGTRSFCLIRGLTNFHYWSYDWWSANAVCPEPVAVTPRVLSRLIPWAHDARWNPADSKSNCHLQLSPEECRQMTAPETSAEPTLHSESPGSPDV